MRIDGRRPVPPIQSVTVEEVVAGTPAPAGEIQLKIADPEYRYVDALDFEPGKTVVVHASLSGRDSEADFIPQPKRPRSSSPLCSSG